MSANAHAISGKVILHAHIEAKSIEAADELAKLILKIKKHTETDEPGTLTYRLCRFEHQLMVFEEYDNADAFDFHETSEEFKDFIKAVPALCTKPPSITFYKELSLDG
ncbi:hypothetical protein FRB99_006968 [Tulasnella sp. 403]|nr:hypothetical protein FRB99_006968 [Tulasnella sp. 403]